MRCMKKFLAVLLALMCFVSSVSAATVVDDTYSDAPATSTQDNVKEIRAEYLPENMEKVPCSVIVMEPTQHTVDVLKDIFDFVDIVRRPPIRWFPEEIYKEVEKIIGGNPDGLYMPEFMSLLPEEMQLDADVKVDMHMHIDYKKGQTVVPVLGRMTEEGLVWKALPAQVVEEKEDDNIIHFIVPRDVAAQYAGNEVLFALLADKPGSGEQEKEQVIREEEVFIPSKNASDIIYVVDEVVRNLAGEPVDCQILIVPKTKRIEKELALLTEHFIDPEKIPVRYFDEETVNETALIMKDVDIDTLLPYEFVSVMSKDYLEPYGDVMAKFAFPTPFKEDKAIIAFIGMPDPEDKDAFLWAPLPAELDETKKHMEITFTSSVLTAMMKDAGLLLVMSQPLDEMD